MRTCIWVPLVRDRDKQIMRSYLVCVAQRSMKESYPLYWGREICLSEKRREWQRMKNTGSQIHTRWSSYACMKWPSKRPHEKIKWKILRCITVHSDWNFKSLFLMFWIAEKPLSLTDFSTTYLLLLKGMHEGKYSCKLREILRVSDTRTFPTFRIQAISCTECCFKSTSSPASNLFFKASYEVCSGAMRNMPSVTGPCSLMRTRMSWEEERERPVTHYAAQSTMCSWKPDPFVHMCSAKDGKDKEEFELVLWLSLLIYTSHPNVNHEKSGNPYFFLI